MKYYVVQFSKKNTNPELQGGLILSNWDECQKLLKKEPGGRVKSFPTHAGAQSFLAQSQEFNRELDNRDAIFIYVDGSYRPTKGNTPAPAGWAWVAVKYDQVIDQSSGVTAQIAESRNIDGELTAVMMGVEHVSKAYPGEPIVVCHDYQGIASWVTGEWKAKSPISQHYKTTLSNFTSHHKISFKKVTAHSGEIWNELADELAKKTLDNLDTEPSND